MKPYYQEDKATIYCGDCIEVMAEMPENSVDAIMTDPPYGLEFMGKEWDKFGPNQGRKDLRPSGQRLNISDFKDGVGRISNMPKKNPRCRKCGRLQFDHDKYKCQCETPNFDHRYSEYGFTYQYWTTQWATQALRVLKPGGYLLAFGGTRTHHRLVCGLEDAGFEIRDTICWLYGSGFPKNLDISKQIDKRGGYPQLSEEIGRAIKAARKRRRLSVSECDKQFCDGTTNWTWFEGRPSGQRAPTPATFARIVKAWPELASLAEMIQEAEREVVGRSNRCVGPSQAESQYFGGAKNWADSNLVTAPATEAAKEWQGWGTALKPAVEFVCCARKPLSEKTVAENVLKWGTGGMDIDGARIPTSKDDLQEMTGRSGSSETAFWGSQKHGMWQPPQGRWPANVILDEEAARMLDEQSGELVSGIAIRHRGVSGGHIMSRPKPVGTPDLGYRDSGGASRFYYVAKASSLERGKNNKHPTCKPVALMEYLIKLVSRKDSVILDPFGGSMSTVLGAVALGRRIIAIEQSEEYCEMLKGRCRQMELGV